MRSPGMFRLSAQEVVMLKAVLVALLIVAETPAEAQPVQPKPPRDPYRTAAIWLAVGGGALLVFASLHPLDEFCYGKLGDYDCEQPNWPAWVGGGTMIAAAIALEHKASKRKRAVSPFIRVHRRAVAAGAQIRFSGKR